MSPEESQRLPLDELAEEFVERCRRGERPALSEYTERHPDLADQIRELFPGLLLMEELARAPEPPRAESSPEVGLRELGDFRIVREVGRGGMGVVYEAMQLSLSRRVALKVLPQSQQLSPGHLKRFQLEARAAARLHHSNIVPVHEVGEVNGIHYYAMQFIQGQGLDAVLDELRRLRTLGKTASRDQGSEAGQVARALGSGAFSLSTTTARLPETGPTPESSASIHLPGQSDTSTLTDPDFHYFRTVALIGVQVADALAYAHEQGVLHRDIKPSNLLLDVAGRVWITDFGLAKEEGGDALTQAGDVVGTLRYMAPERFKGGSDPRSDVYSLGATLYELLLLRPPFHSSQRATLIDQVLHDEPQAPRRIDRRVPRDLETIVLKSMQKEPAHRYQGAAEMRQDLEHFLEARPIAARRISAGERAWLWCRRNRMLASLITAIAALLLTGAVGAGWMAWNLSLERNAAVKNLWTSLLAQAQAGRWSRQVGQRWKSLEAIERAAAIRPALELRNEAIACLALTDVKEVREWPAPAGISGWAFDAPLGRYAVTYLSGDVKIMRVEEGGEVCAFPGFGLAADYVWFSPDGRFLAVRYGEGRQLRVWDLERRELSWKLPDGIWSLGLDFSPESRAVAAGPTSGGLVLVDILAGQELVRSQVGGKLTTLKFHNRGETLALCSDDRVILWDSRTKTEVRRLQHPNLVYDVAWHPDGNLIAAACGDHRIYLWEAWTGRRYGDLEGHQAEATNLTFSPRGDLLRSRGWDGYSFLWDPRALSQWVRWVGGAERFSPDGRLLSNRRSHSLRILEVVTEGEFRTFREPDARGKGPRFVDIHPECRIMVSAGHDGVRLWDLYASRELAFLALGVTRTALFIPGERKFLTSGDRGLALWPVQMEPPGERWRVGPPEVLWRESGFGDATMDAAGSTVAVRYHDKPCIINPKAPGAKRLLDGDPHLEHLSISPDGRWIAGGTWGGNEVRIWGVKEEVPLKVIRGIASARTFFSRCGRWLLISSDDFQLWRTGTWAHGITIARSQGGGGARPAAAFAPDGRHLAIAISRSVVRLVELESGKEVATLEPPVPAQIAWLSFSADGRLLAAAATNHVIQVWDLGKIRKSLGRVGLDWDAPPLPSGPSIGEARRSPVEAVVDLGEMAKPAPQTTDRERHEESVRRLTQVLERNPGNAEAHHERGHAFAGLGEWEKAADDFSVALKAGSRPGHLHEARAEAYEKMGRPEEALEDLKSALRLEPESPNLLWKAACLNKNLKRYEDAAALHEKLLEREPGRVLALNNLAWIYLTGPESLRQPRRALELAQKALELKPGDYPSMNTLGVAWFRLGEFTKAKEQLEAAAAVAGGTAFDFYFLAMVCHSLGEREAALAALEKAVRWREAQKVLLPEAIEELDRFQKEAEEALRLARS